MELGGEFYLDLHTLSEKNHSVDAYLSRRTAAVLRQRPQRAALCRAEPASRNDPSAGVHLRFRHHRLFRPRAVLLPTDAFAGDRHGRPSLQAERGSLRRFSDALLRRGTTPGHIGAVEAARLRYGFSIVEDTTHSVFSVRRTIGDLCVCSLRKWFALPGGGALYGPAPCRPG